MAICRRGISFYYKRNFAEALRDLEAAYKLDKSIPNIATYVVMAKKKVKNQN
jgi:lipoprotein NlpI